MLSGLTTLLALSIYMSNVLTQNWKENGKAFKGLREGFLQKICTSEKVVKTLVLNICHLGLRSFVQRNFLGDLKGLKCI